MVTKALTLLLHAKPWATKMRQLNEYDASHRTTALAADPSGTSTPKAGKAVCGDTGELAG
jgi:hypothetical protein